MLRATFVLGAGASAAEGAATGRAILRDAFELFPDNRKVQNVKEFLTVFFGEGNPTFEEALTLVDVAISKREALTSRWNYQQLAELRENLLYALVMTLDKQLQTTAPIHSQFVRSLFEHRPEETTFSFISLNYDILLDNALTRAKETFDMDLDYAVDFRNFGDDWTKPRADRAVSLLKLHGSLNWLYCPNCNTLKITPLEKGVTRIWTNFETCEIDRTEQQPLLIPPTWVKLYDNARLLHVWTRAEEVLRGSDLVFFIGYSLPESDVHVRYLLTKSLHRDDPQDNPLVAIVTSKNISNKPSETAQRYERLFKNTKVLETGFEDFTDGLSDLLSPILSEVTRQ